MREKAQSKQQKTGNKNDKNALLCCKALQSANETKRKRKSVKKHAGQWEEKQKNARNKGKKAKKREKRVTSAKR